MENSFYEGLAELFPDSYSSGELSTADSGKLLVLSDLLTAIRQLSPSDRFVSCLELMEMVANLIEIKFEYFDDHLLVSHHKLKGYIDFIINEVLIDHQRGCRDIGVF